MILHKALSSGARLHKALSSGARLHQTYPANSVWNASPCCASPEHTGTLRRAVELGNVLAGRGGRRGRDSSHQCTHTCRRQRSSTGNTALPTLRGSSHVPLVLLHVGCSLNISLCDGSFDSITVKLHYSLILYMKELDCLVLAPYLQLQQPHVYNFIQMLLFLTCWSKHCS